MAREEIAVVTGSSTGIGFETSLTLARNGFHTYATMRRLEGSKGSDYLTDMAKTENLPIQSIQLDVDNDNSVSEAINTIMKERGRIDIVINNAGYALAGPFEETSMAEIRAQFETNFFGAVRVMQAVIPKMREQRSGKIFNITSMGGRIAVPLDSIYHGTKFALEGLSESLQYELEPFGIKFVLIEPGAVNSNFWRNLKISSKTSSPDNIGSPYKQIVSNVSASFRQMEQNTIHPSEVAKVILQAVLSANPDFRYVVGKDAVAFIEARRSMADKEFQSLVKRQFNLQ
ncbi:MAG TPA: SDR family oxidoreductase [Nitrososphaera sp.]|jgi:short-subunit dehydrogenase|nr:SDR family oxidoreductase [Nitrososphaera sp.]